MPVLTGPTVNPNGLNFKGTAWMVRTPSKGPASRTLDLNCEPALSRAAQMTCTTGSLRKQKATLLGGQVSFLIVVKEMTPKNLSVQNDFCGCRIWELFGSTALAHAFSSGCKLARQWGLQSLAVLTLTMAPQTWLLEGRRIALSSRTPPQAA